MALTPGKLLLMLFLKLHEQVSDGAKSYPCDRHFHMASPNVCLTVGGTTDSFCEANEICARLGDRLKLPLFLVGADYEHVHMVSSRNYAWTGITRLLTLTPSEPLTWRYSSTIGAPTVLGDSDLRWAVGQPNVSVYNLDAIAERQVDKNKWLLKTGELRDSSATSGDAICQQDLVRSRSQIGPTEGMTARFSLPDFGIPLVVEHPDGAPGTGCHELLHPITSQRHCQISCARKWFCRAIFYNRERGTCVLSLYSVMSLVIDTGSRGDWDVLIRDR